MTSQDAYKSFEDLNQYWFENSKLLDDLLIYIKEKADLDRFYGRGLEKLSKLSLFNSSIPSLSFHLQTMKSSIMEVSNYFSTNSSFINGEVCQKLRNTISAHETCLKDYNKKINSLRKTRKKLMKKYYTYREKFRLQDKTPETIIPLGKYFMSEVNPLDLYKESIRKLNDFNKAFQEQVPVPAQYINEKALEKFKVFKNILQDLISSDATCIYAMKMHIDKISPELAKMDFSAEQVSLQSLLENSITIPTISFVENSSSNLSLRRSHLELRSRSPDNELKDILFKSWLGVQVSDSEFSGFAEIVRTSEGKKNFISLLNEKRKLHEFLVPSNTFEDLGKSFRIVLDSLMLSKNFACARQCIILSQTFYTKEKKFVQALILDHPLWQMDGFWKDLIQESIDKEITGLVEIEGENMEAEVKNMRNKTIIIANLASYIDVMGSFFIKKENILEIAEFFKQKFSITEEELPLAYILGLVNAE